MRIKLRKSWARFDKPRRLKKWDTTVALSQKRGRSFNRQMQDAIYSVYKFTVQEGEHGSVIIPLSNTM